MFIAGYRGSPVGGLDQAFMAQNKLLTSHDIVFSNGLNEDLAATAVWGTQMLHSVGKQKFDARARHLVRQGAGGRSQRRRAEARQLHGHPEERRGARDLRRRPELQVVVADEPVRARPLPLGHSVDLSRQPAGHPRLRPPRLHDVARVRLLDRPQDRHQRRRRYRQRRSLARPHQADHSGGRVRRQAVRAAHEPRHERARPRRSRWSTRSTTRASRWPAATRAPTSSTAT